MANSSIRWGFCAALAVISAAFADPLVEFASNAGWFGRGSFTDHSNLDVVPTLVAGAGLMVLYLVRRAPWVVAGRAFPRGVTPLLPTIFLLQILTLYGMETAEQLLVFGHVLGPAVWLGAPPLISLTIHAATCFAVTLWFGRSIRTLAATTLRVIRLIRAIATLAVRSAGMPARRVFYARPFKELAPVLCSIGERAPPIAAL
ncbi:MAG: hypothetical protein JO190_02955 [Candidatus Eremiobacteraeota bacterium]|nr:hypothetical protein [Candidatus Eremiobacteraeota bacterium]MBV8498839.1 hypothetical protein [Candidatus Eremiobacteraeota bacterium]